MLAYKVTEKWRFVLQHTAIVTAKEVCLVVFMTKEQYDYERAQMTLLWGHHVFVHNAQRAPAWHISSWEVTLAADTPLSSHSTFHLLLLLCSGWGRQSGDREDRKKWARGEGGRAKGLSNAGVSSAERGRVFLKPSHLYLYKLFSSFELVIKPANVPISLNSH